MLRTLTVAGCALIASTTVANAQLVVIDPANLTQTVMIAERTWQHYQELRRQYETILRMSRGLGNMEGYRIPTIAITAHDPSRWEYGRPWIQALNSGDATGAAIYWNFWSPRRRLVRSGEGVPVARESRLGEASQRSDARPW